MKKLAILIPCAFFLIIVGCNPKDEAYTIQKLNDSVFEISFQSYKAEINANASGRVVSFALSESETLADHHSHPFNYGSTLWPAPQVEWNWPPPENLDGKPYQLTNQEGMLELISEICPTTGLQFKKQFYFDLSDSAFVLDYSIINKKGEPRYAEAWEVTRVPGHLSFFPLYKDSIYSISNLMSTQNINGVLWYKHNWDSLPNSQKLFADATEGWLAHVTRDKLLFLKKFEDIPLKSQAPGQGEIEIYASSDFDYIELENHGKNTLLQPEESLNCKVKWYLTKIPEGIELELGNQELVDFVRDFKESKN